LSSSSPPSTPFWLDNPALSVGNSSQSMDINLRRKQKEKENRIIGLYQFALNTHFGTKAVWYPGAGKGCKPCFDFIVQGHGAHLAGHLGTPLPHIPRNTCGSREKKKGTAGDWHAGRRREREEQLYLSSLRWLSL